MIKILYFCGKNRIVMAFRKLLIVICIIFTAFIAATAARTWENVDSLPSQAHEQRALTEEIYTTTNEGYVYVAIRQPMTVKVFTILGQLISEENLNPGIYRYRLESRGIYLLKAGAITRRIIV